MKTSKTRRAVVGVTAALSLLAAGLISAAPANAAYSYFWYAQDKKLGHKERAWSGTYTITRTRTVGSGVLNITNWAQTLNAATASNNDYAVEVFHAAISSKSASWWSTSLQNPTSKLAVSGASYRSTGGGGGGMRVASDAAAVELPELISSDLTQSLVPGSITFLGEAAGTSYWEARDVDGFRLLISELPSGITGVSYAEADDDVVALRVNSETDPREVSEAYLLADMPSEVKAATAGADVLGGRLVVVDPAVDAREIAISEVSAANARTTGEPSSFTIERLWTE